MTTWEQLADELAATTPADSGLVGRWISFGKAMGWSTDLTRSVAFDALCQGFSPEILRSHEVTGPFYARVNRVLDEGNSHVPSPSRRPARHAAGEAQ